MGLIIHKFNAEKWKEFAKTAHQSVFDKELEKSSAEIDYALVIVEEKTNTPCAYVTVKDVNNGVCYWQHGGAFPNARGTALSFRSYKLAVEWAGERYKHIFTYIENTNADMLKFALAVGFKIIGIKLVLNKLMVELNLKF